MSNEPTITREMVALYAQGLLEDSEDCRAIEAQLGRSASEVAEWYRQETQSPSPRTLKILRSWREERLAGRIATPEAPATDDVPRPSLWLQLAEVVRASYAGSRPAVVPALDDRHVEALGGYRLAPPLRLGSADRLASDDSNDVEDRFRWEGDTLRLVDRREAIPFGVVRVFLLDRVQQHVVASFLAAVPLHRRSGKRCENISVAQVVSTGSVRELVPKVVAATNEESFVCFPLDEVRRLAATEAVAKDEELSNSISALIRKLEATK